MYLTDLFPRQGKNKVSTNRTDPTSGAGCRHDNKLRRCSMAEAGTLRNWWNANM